MDYTSAKTSDTKKFAEYFRYMLGNGVYIASSQFEAMFISDAHTDEEIQHTLNIMHNYLRNNPKMLNKRFKVCYYFRECEQLLQWF